MLLAHENPVVTRTVYLHVKSAEAKARRRAKMEARYVSVSSGPNRSGPNGPSKAGEVA